MKRFAPKNGDDYHTFCWGDGPPTKENPDAWPITTAQVDPSDLNWQKIVKFNAQTVADLGAKGIYLDTYGRGYHPDSDIAHNHNGHGIWWNEAQKQLGTSVLDVLRASAPNGVRGISASEYFNEALMPNIDLVMNHAPSRPSDIPLIWSVYSGYQMHAGDTGSRATLAADKAAIWGRSFVWGSQLGLVGGNKSALACTNSANYEMCSPDDAMVSYLRQLAQARNSALLNPYLAFGELLDSADDISSIPENSGEVTWCDASKEGASCKGQVRKVRGARWKAPVGSDEIIVLTNTDIVAHTAVIAKPARWDSAVLYGLNAGQADAGISITPALDKKVFTVDMPGRSIKVLKGAVTTTYSSPLKSFIPAQAVTINIKEAYQGPADKIIYVKGSYFSPTDTFTIYDTDGKAWRQNLPVALTSTTETTNFRLPALYPPSQCNFKSSCFLRFRITRTVNNETSVAWGGVTILQIAPVITSAEQAAPGMYASLVTVVGAGFSPTDKFTVYDSKGNIWGSNLGIYNPAVDGSYTSFILPSLKEPNGCNALQDCKLKFRVAKTTALYSEGYFTLRKN